MTTRRKPYLPFFERLARLGAVAVAAIGGVVLIGWLLDIPLLKSLLPGLVSMKVNTACGFAACGAALWLLHTGKAGSRGFHAARILATIVVAVGGASLAQDIFALDFGIDQFFLRDSPPSPTNLYPGRMAPITAGAFVFMGLALLALKSHRPRMGFFVNWIVWPPLFISALAITGYAYGVDSLYQVKPFTPMALPTALAFLLLSLSLVAANPQRGMIWIAASDTAGGLVLRQLIPTITVSIFALGWIRLEGQQIGLYGAEFGLALMVLFSALHRVDVTRSRGDTKISVLTEGMEGMVLERTSQRAELSTAQDANRSLEKLSHEDGLTSLANRRHFDLYLANQMALARRKRQTLALVMCDVDEFKAYNDHYGHQAGDECLRQVAAALKSCCRRPTDMAARYGGEEFALILPDTALSGAFQIAEQARWAVAQLKIPHEHSAAAGVVTFSGGIAVFMAHFNTTEQQLIEAADDALFQAKRAGRNRIISVRDAAA